MYDKLKTLVLYNLYGAGRLPWKYDMHSTNLIVEAYNEVDSAVQKMVKQVSKIASLKSKKLSKTLGKN